MVALNLCVKRLTLVFRGCQTSDKAARRQSCQGKSSLARASQVWPGQVKSGHNIQGLNSDSHSPKFAAYMPERTLLTRQRCLSITTRPKGRHVGGLAKQLSQGCKGQKSFERPSSGVWGLAAKHAACALQGLLYIASLPTLEALLQLWKKQPRWAFQLDVRRCKTVVQNAGAGDTGDLPACVRRCIAG